MITQMNERKIKKRFVVIAAISRFFHKHGKTLMFGLLIIVLATIILSKIEERNQNTFIGVLGRIGKWFSGGFLKIGNGISAFGSKIASGAGTAWNAMTGWIIKK